MGTPIATESLQQRTKERMRSEVARTAVELFLTQGFEETTVDEISAIVGLSRRSFFRYFAAKEDVVLALFDRVAVGGSTVFAATPHEDGIWAALRRSMHPLEQWVEEDPARVLALLRLIERTPTLRARYLDRVDVWRAGLAGLVTTRLGIGGQDGAEVYVAVVAAAAMGAFLAGGRAWAKAGGSVPLPRLFDQAFDAMQPAPPPAPGSGG